MGENPSGKSVRATTPCVCVVRRLECLSSLYLNADHVTQFHPAQSKLVNLPPGRATRTRNPGPAQWPRALDSSMEDDGPRRQIYVRAKQGKPLQTSLDDLLKFFEDAAVGKPTSVLNKWGEEPPDGRVYELALVTFKKNKAVQRALGLSGSYLSDREVATGT